MTKKIRLGTAWVGPGHPCYLVGEVGTNHNGDPGLAMKIFDLAKDSGFHCVKLQKRSPDHCVPEYQKSAIKETPWGPLSYLDYRKRVEFSPETYRLLADHCKISGIDFTASAWDLPSLEFLLGLDIPFIKIPSAKLTDSGLLRAASQSGISLVLSTGMSSLAQIDHAVNLVLRYNGDLVLCHCHSAYPAPSEELNLRVIAEYAKRYPECVIGYSGHETEIEITLAAVALGASFIERHITFDRKMWGTDQTCSLDPEGMRRLARSIRLVDVALGDGVKRVYDSELAAINKLRGI